MMAYAGIKYTKKYNKELVLYCLDLWPDSLVAGNVKRGSVVYKIFHSISNKIYHQADRILITSREFKKYFISEFNIDEKKIEYLPQYAENIFTEEVNKNIYKKDTFDMMFAGNIGAAQSVQTIIRAAKELETVRNIKWYIVGDGSELENCKKLVDELKLNSIIFYGRKPISEMLQYYAMADVMLVTLSNDPILSLTLPSKVQTYMAAGKPIIGAANGETAVVINEAGCGYCCAAEDYMALADLVLTKYDNEECKKFSNNAISYYRKHFTKESYINLLMYELQRAGEAY
jgi:glycosyltransferase involved in cell wall biosynthesis